MECEGIQLELDELKVFGSRGGHCVARGWQNQSGDGAVIYDQLVVVQAALGPGF